MGKGIWLIVLIFLTGCAVTTVSTTPSQEEQTVEAPPAKDVEHVFPSKDAIDKLLIGVSREEALALIGRTVTVGYELREGSTDEYQPVTSPNPYRSQQITTGKDVYQVDYYLTRINTANGTISDDELTPLVFESNKLIGKGWEFFREKVKK